MVIETENYHDAVKSVKNRLKQTFKACRALTDRVTHTELIVPLCDLHTFVLSNNLQGVGVN